ncbi:Ig-like domain-containing protein [Pseudomonas fluorescens]|uniref:Ig-like domain-containing protein n=1 Tax=Pseudomonas fluorescens TaxID=294 RepID=UPI00124284F4|nr:Ig-like domain-containing protein [Pseudomonas fluorescens]
MKGSHVVDRAESFAKTTVSANTVSAVVALVADASTSTVTALSASPTSIVADDAATSTISATVRDANGNLLPAGQVVTFATNLGTLSASTAATNASGVASVSLRSSVAGTATVTARGTTTATRNLAVTMVSAAPVISSFTVGGRTYGGSRGYSAGYIVTNGDSGIYEDNLFNWAATGADRYEIVDAWGSTLYSGTASTYRQLRNPVPSKSSVHFNAGTPVFKSTVTLKAIKGSDVTTTTINITYDSYYCNGGCSG